MRIAIVTVYDSVTNCGSFLQAYALMQVLEEKGHEVFFVRRMPDEDVLKRFHRLSYVNSGVDQVAFWNVPRKLSRFRRLLRGRKLNRIRYEKAREDWKLLKVIEPEALGEQGIECIICGSDEIWNPDNRDIDMDFYTCGWVQRIPLAAYAISSGQSEAEALSNDWRENIRRFRCCLPRDEKTAALLETLGADCGSIVCDPTILLGRDRFAAVSLPQEEAIQEPYMLVYSYVYSKPQARALRAYAAAHGLKIVSVSIFSECADRTVYPSALAFPELVRNAACMYTSTFHGTIFGLMFAKKLAILPRLSKISSVVHRCEAEKNTVETNFTQEDLERIFSADVAHEPIEARMKEMRDHSERALERLLEEAGR